MQPNGSGLSPKRVGKFFLSFVFLLLLVLGGVVSAVAAASAPLEGEAGLVVTVPLKDAITAAKSKRTNLFTLSDKNYAFALNTVKDDDGNTWLRAVIAQGDSFYGAIMVNRVDLLMDAVSLEVTVKPPTSKGTTDFLLRTLPDEREVSLTLPLRFDGLAHLAAFTDEIGGSMKSLDGNTEMEATTAAALEVGAGAVETTVRPAVTTKTYIAVYALLFGMLALLVLGQVFRLQLRTAAAAVSGAVLRGGVRFAVRIRNEWAAATGRAPSLSHPAALAPDAEDASVPLLYIDALELLEIIPQSEAGSVDETVTLTLPSAAPEDIPPLCEQINAVYTGSRKPTQVQGNLVTVALRNREALGSSEEAVPLFSPNPRGQIISLAPAAGELYLHVQAFAFPACTVQQVLQSVYLPRLFDLEDKHGNPIGMPEATGRQILHLAPAKTKVTAAGYLLAAKGRITVGD
ncbi:MAG: hypothetical protein LBR73_02070 [Oscillospiraceae bacterium]|jgi:hypothetical protein|nr:hypothetical protein [Oscillospiraceae bacterium]